MKKFLTCILAIAISLLSFSVFANNYAIIVDAGSTGSRLHIFQYTESAMPVITDVFSNHTEPGLSSYSNQPEQAANTLKESLDKAVEFLKKNGVDNMSSVKISILATAGMRLVPEDQQKAIYDNITQYIKNHYAFSISDIKTISGQMEGLYGWMDVNYLLGNFQNNKPTVGSIDMGGASTQIAFATQNSVNPDDKISVNINNQKYSVFSASFLGLGQDQARNAMETYGAASACYPKNATFGGTKVGNFNIVGCDDAYINVIQNQHIAQQIPPTAGQPSFYAYSGIYFTYHFFHADQQPADADSINLKIHDVCSESWEILKNRKSDYS